MAEPTLDAVLQIVADRQRRQVLQQLQHEGTGNTTIDDLADQLHNGGSTVGDQPTDRDQLTIQLYHNHLPTLADHGVVEFEPENGAIRYQPDEQIETVLEALPEERPRARP